MGISRTALFNCLVEDLSGLLSKDVVDEKSAALEPVAPDMTFEQVAALLLSKSLLKKFTDGFQGAAADATALKKFLLTNERCKDWSMSQCNTSADEELVGSFKRTLYDFFYRGGTLVGSSADFFDVGRTGPGASLLARGNDFYTKLFSSPLSCTGQGIRSMYEASISGSVRWALAEKLRAATYGDPVEVPGNKLQFVPKNTDTSRVICVEPNLNMFAQLGFGALIVDRLKDFFGIDLSSQPDINRDLAQIGSANDRLCTIDLESASDSIALPMVEELFPPNIVGWLRLLRSKETSYNGRSQELYMLSSMGNGFTFPIQTLIFCCVVSVVYSSLGLRMRRSRDEILGNFGVFGDDIIIVREAYPRVLRLLSLLGFTVNTEKSFFEGPFRESCGGDFFLGRSCRGVYIKSLKTQQSRCVAINRLNDWTARTGIPIPRTVSYVLGRTRFLPVPLYENDDAGVKVPLTMVEKLKRDPDVQSILYRRYEPKPVMLKITEGAVKHPKGTRSRVFNPEGLLIAFLRGDIVADRIGIRMGPARYKAKWAISPGWDWLPTTRRGLLVDESRLINAITANMC